MLVPNSIYTVLVTCAVALGVKSAPLAERGCYYGGSLTVFAEAGASFAVDTVGTTV